MTAIRQCVPGQFYQGVDEQKSYIIDVTNWMTSPTAACAVIKEGTTVRSTSLFSSGAASTGATISGCQITTPCLVSLTAGTDYRVEVKFYKSGEWLECFFFVTGET